MVPRVVLYPDLNYIILGRFQMGINKSCSNLNITNYNLFTTDARPKPPVGGARRQDANQTPLMG